MRQVLFLLFLTQLIFANIVKLDSKVSAVTVFNDRAEVKREVIKELQKGEYILKFSSLPDSIDRNSIRVEGSGDIVIKDVSIKKIFLADVYQKKLKELHLKRDAILDEMNIVLDSQNRLTKERLLVDNIIKRVTTVSSEENRNLVNELDMDNWEKVIKFYGAKIDTLDEKSREFRKKYTKLNKKSKKTDYEISSYGNFQNRYNYEVGVSVEAKNSTKVKLFLSYITYRARWYPIYDIRVASDKKEVNLAYNAMVSQNSGEDWSGVALKLSTAKPSIGGSHPQLSPWYISQYHPSKTKALKLKVTGRNMMQMYGKKDVILNKFEGETKERITFEESIIDSKISSALFRLNQKADIPSDNTPHKVTIMIKPFKVNFRYSTVPKLSKYAYLKAKIVNSSNYPLIAGKANIYLDNNFIANSKIKTVSSGEDFWVFLGADEDVKIEYKRVSKLKDTEGIINKVNIVTYEYKIEITNNKKSDIEIVCWDQLPISNDEKIEVEMITPKYDKLSKIIKMNDKKLVEWIKYIKPKSKSLIPFKFSIKYPKDMRVDLP